VLLEEGPQTRVNPPGEPVTILVKSRESRRGRVMAVINTTAEPQEVAIPEPAAWLTGAPGRWQDLTPDTIPLKFAAPLQFTLPPTRMRVFYSPDGAPLTEEEIKPAGAEG
jgi:hypothetical protein